MKIGRLSIPTLQGAVAIFEDMDLTLDELKAIAEMLQIITRPPTAMPVGPSIVECEFAMKCTDRYTGKCKECANNLARSYFKGR